MDKAVLRKVALRAIGVLGATMFLSFFAVTFSVPGWVETFAADYIESEAQKRLDSTIDAIRPGDSDSALTTLAQTIYERNETQIEKQRERLRNRVHEQWAFALAAVRDLDCECRKKWESYFESGFRSDIAFLEATNDQVSRLIHSNYMDVVTELKTDIRIFTGSNAAVFLFLLAVSFTKPQAITHLFLPGLLLLASTLVCSYFYIFEQNWLLTVIHNSYLGFLYLLWLGVVFGFLCDIVLNKARVTAKLLNSVGSGVSVGPC